MTEPQQQPDAESSEQPTAQQEPADPPAPYDPERGLRGIMSGILILEAIALLLGLTVLSNGGRDAAVWELGTVTALALAHMVTPALVKKRLFLPVIFALQILVIAAWLINWAIGVIGVMFLLVWIGVLRLRHEFRRRLAAGMIVPAPGHQVSPTAGAQPGTENEEK